MCDELDPHGHKAVMSRRVAWHGACVWILRISMGKPQEGVCLLVISLSYPRQTLPNADLDVQWPCMAVASSRCLRKKTGLTARFPRQSL